MAFFFAGTADTKGLPVISGLVGHSGKHGCRLYCGFPGRHKPGAPMYYPAVLKPNNHYPDDYHHPDFDVANISSPNINEYLSNLQRLLQATTMAMYKELHLEAGISRPSICLGLQADLMLAIPSCFPLDLMHLCSLNILQLMIDIWQNKVDPKVVFHTSGKPSFIVLDMSDAWKTHGTLVASTRPYLPSSFDRPPRNPALKINSGYKVCEFLLYFWVLGPAVFRLILPHHLWRHYCKLVCATRIVHQRKIYHAQIVQAHDLLIQWEKEFEEEYYAHNIDHLHLIRPCIHSMVHLAQETI